MSPENRFCTLFPIVQSVLAWIAALLLLVTPRASGQGAGSATTFAIDPNRPFVYLRFDHMGPGIRRSEEEPSLRIWLRLVNNCRVPIIVSTFGVPDGSPKGEIGVMDEVVPVVVSGVVQGVGPVPLIPLSPPPLAPPLPEQQPSAKAKSDEMPSGYMLDVGSTESISPGEDVFFSVPSNHVGKQWYFEIPFRFDLLKGKGPRDPSIGGEPHMVIEYSMWDLPTKSRANIEQK